MEEKKKVSLLDDGPILGEAGILSVDDAPSRRLDAAKLLNGIEKSYDPGRKLLDESARVAELKDTLFLNTVRRVRNSGGARVFGWAKDGEMHLPPREEG